MNTKTVGFWFAMMVSAAAVGLLGCAAPVDSPESDPNRASGEQVDKAQQASTSCYVLSPADDTQVRGDMPDTPFGAKPSVVVGATVPANVLRYGLIRFDLSSFSGTVVSATLNLDVIQQMGPGTIVFGPLEGAPWSESTLTLDGLLDGTRFAAPTGFFTSTLGPVDVDLTRETDAWLTGAMPNEGLLLASVDGVNQTYGSKENPSGAVRPTLTVCLSGGH